MGKYTTLLYDKKKGVVTITLNRPERLNAWNPTMGDEMIQALNEAEADNEVGVIILTGAGRAFCAGVDLKERAERGDKVHLPGGRRDVRLGPYYRVWNSVKPVIGAINGVCVTGGLEFALGCDFLIASENATFGDTHTRIGYLPGGGMTQFLPRRIGPGRAKEMMLTANFISAQQAYEWGLVNHVVPADQLMPLAEKLAQDIMSCYKAPGSKTPTTVPRTKRSVNNSQNYGLDVGLELEKLEESRWRDSGEQREAQRKPSADAAISRGREQMKARK